MLIYSTFALAERYADPTAFLATIGRSSDKKLKVENLDWEGFWRLDGLAMKKEGVSVQDRRCVAGVENKHLIFVSLCSYLRVRAESSLKDTFCGQWKSSVKERIPYTLRGSRKERRKLEGKSYPFAIKHSTSLYSYTTCHNPIRRRGPAVQNGKRIRSRRKQ